MINTVDETQQCNDRTPYTILAQKKTNTRGTIAAAPYQPVWKD
jgi:hypothetical protein